jgi:hypothetical protein
MLPTNFKVRKNSETCFFKTVLLVIGNCSVALKQTYEIITVNSNFWEKWRQTACRIIIFMILAWFHLFSELKLGRNNFFDDDE